MARVGWFLPVSPPLPVSKWGVQAKKWQKPMNSDVFQAKTTHILCAKTILAQRNGGLVFDLEPILVAKTKIAIRLLRWMTWNGRFLIEKLRELVAKIEIATRFSLSLISNLAELTWKRPTLIVKTNLAQSFYGR
jgi:hypothetical protein